MTSQWSSNKPNEQKKFLPVAPGRPFTPVILPQPPMKPKDPPPARDLPRKLPTPLPEPTPNNPPSVSKPPILAPRPLPEPVPSPRPSPAPTPRRPADDGPRCLCLKTSPDDPCPCPPPSIPPRTTCCDNPIRGISCICAKPAVVPETPSNRIPRGNPPVLLEPRTVPTSTSTTQDRAKTTISEPAIAPRPEVGQRPVVETPVSSKQDNTTIISPKNLNRTLPQPKAPEPRPLPTVTSPPQQDLPTFVTKTGAFSSAANAISGTNPLPVNKNQIVCGTTDAAIRKQRLNSSSPTTPLLATESNVIGKTTLQWLSERGPNGEISVPESSPIGVVNALGVLGSKDAGSTWKNLKDLIIITAQYNGMGWQGANSDYRSPKMYWRWTAELSNLDGGDYRFIITKNNQNGNFLPITQTSNTVRVKSTTTEDGNTVIGYALMWGTNMQGQLGVTRPALRTVPDEVVHPQKNAGVSWTSIQCGETRTVAIDSNKKLWSWGEISSKLTVANNATPTKVNEDNWKAIGTGWDGISYAINENGALYFLGNDASYVQNSKLFLTPSTTPVRLFPEASQWTMVSAGNSFAIALNQSGELISWGVGSSGQLGDGMGIDRRLTGVNIPNYQGIVTGGFLLRGTWKYISCGMDFALAIDMDNRIWGWGNAFNGALGPLVGVRDSKTIRKVLDNRGNPIRILEPVLVEPRSYWKKVTCHGSKVFALDNQGQIWTWGGISASSKDYSSSTVPRVLAGRDWLDIESGYTRCVAVKLNGDLYGWGTSYNGPIGNGTTSGEFDSPIKIGNINMYPDKRNLSTSDIQLSAGRGHTSALFKSVAIL